MGRKGGAQMLMGQGLWEMGHLLGVFLLPGLAELLRAKALWGRNFGRKNAPGNRSCHGVT